jgi:5-methylcytosine-specific restriction endonuclease McrA
MGGQGSGPRRSANSPDRGHRDWYQLERWRKLAKAQLRREPLCARCLDVGRVTPATVADHVVAHGGDWNRFLLGKLQSLCASCHSGAKQFEEVHGYYPDIGLDGFPLDPRHPVYRRR